MPERDQTAVEDGGTSDAGRRHDPGGQDAGALEPALPSKVPPRGRVETLDIGSWNIRWLGDPGQAPKDDALQLENAREVLLGAELDIWGLAEIVDGASLDALKRELPGFDGFLVDDPRVKGGADFYAPGEQKLGILYRSSLATLRSASVILTDRAASFAGRPPLAVHLSVELGGVTRELFVIVLHMKAFDDAYSWNRRKSASEALKAYLDTEHDDDLVIVLGDFNDTLVGSIVTGKDSPYRSFVQDTDYRFATDVLSDVGTTVGRTTAIDHHLLTAELYAEYVTGSAEAYRVDEFIDDYARTTSDHYPVLSRYRWE